MSLLDGLNRRVSRLGFIDMKLLSGSAFFAGLAVATLFPEVLALNVLWFVLFGLACALHPFVRLLARDDGRTIREGAG